MPEDGMIHTPYIKKRFNEFTIDTKQKNSHDQDNVSLKESTLNTSSLIKSKSVDALSKRKKTKKKSMEEGNKDGKNKNNKTEDDLCEDRDENEVNDENLNDTKDTSAEVVEKKPINYTRSDLKPDHWRRIFINLHHTR